MLERSSNNKVIWMDDATNDHPTDAMARPIEVINLENDVPNIVYIRFDSHIYG